MNHNEFPEVMNLKNPCEPLLNYAMGSNQKAKADVVVKTSLGLGVNCAAIVMKRYKDWFHSNIEIQSFKLSNSSLWW